MEVGDYVRTKYGTISKIESKRDYTHGDYEGGENDFYLNVNHSYQNYEEIIKSSPNIIDLIEVGDYVNGNKIIKISCDHCGRTILIWGFDNGDFQCAFTIYKEDIKSIVTKEQFKSMEYEIGE